MSDVTDEFSRRVSDIAEHGLGLSVDLYSPDLLEVVDALRAQHLKVGYLEIFKAATPALTAVRTRLSPARLAYHGEGLWLTQPDLESGYPFEAEVNTAFEHAKILGSAWINHEGASKQMAGYSFGTYLPPLFTPASADLMADNISLVQGTLDRLGRGSGVPGPLLLVETPPLTYFGLGSMPLADFFRRIIDRTPCGLVLDIGHLWTVYRYSGAWRSRSLPRFLGEFLDAFPLERVVEIHVAGLAAHDSHAALQRAGETNGGMGPGGPPPPWWIDAHGAPIPALLFDMLEQVLAHPGLVHLKGLALEVDTKPIREIVREFGRFSERFGRRCEGKVFKDRTIPQPEKPAGPPRHAPTGPVRTGSETQEDLHKQYTQYARIVTGQAGAERPSWHLDPDALARYRQRYLPHEILVWGGEVEAMFPDTCRELRAAGLSLEAFVSFWFKEARRTTEPYDFFLLKLERFQDFVHQVLPPAGETAAREAAGLREAYHRMNEAVGG